MDPAGRVEGERADSPHDQHDDGCDQTDVHGVSRVMGEGKNSTLYVGR